MYYSSATTKESMVVVEEDDDFIFQSVFNTERRVDIKSLEEIDNQRLHYCQQHQPFSPYTALASVGRDWV
jgi:hypothetical protein